MAQCTRCKGTGEEPERELTEAQWAIVDEISALAHERRVAGALRTPEGAQRRKAVYARVRELTDKAVEAGIPKTVVAEALGVSRVQLSNILSKGA
jgi:hypothetical protein